MVTKTEAWGDLRLDYMHRKRVSIIGNDAPQRKMVVEVLLAERRSKQHGV
jgi:hypothetical protein